jgi:CreA protein
VCVEAFHDPKVPGVTCHVSQARTGGVSGSLGLAQDPSQFSLACRQTGPITLPAKLPESETVFTEDTSVLFKETRIVRMWDAANHTLIYLAISRKLIEGAPMNSISTVPVMPWGGRRQCRLQWGARFSSLMRACSRAIPASMKTAVTISAP